MKGLPKTKANNIRKKQDRGISIGPSSLVQVQLCKPERSNIILITLMGYLHGSRHISQEIRILDHHQLHERAQHQQFLSKSSSASFTSNDPTLISRDRNNIIVLMEKPRQS